MITGPSAKTLSAAKRALRESARQGDFDAEIARANENERQASRGFANTVALCLGLLTLVALAAAGWL